MHTSWHLQLPALTNASLNVAQTSAHKFQVTVVHVFELDYFHDITQQHKEVMNVSLLHAFTKVLCTIHNVNYAQTFRDQFLIAFNIYLTILHSVWSQVDMALGRTDPDWHLRHGCLPCTFEQPNECPLYPASLKAMDGNNSVKHMANAGSADLCIFPSRYMIPLDQVDMFKDDIQLRPGECRADQLTFCTDNWKATNSTEENTMRRFGELAKYPLTTINKLLDVFGDNQAIGSDIGCSLSKTVAASSIRDKAFNHKLLLSVNAFHGHAHNCKCQLQYHPIIFNNYKQAVTLIDDFTKELDAYRLSFPDQAMYFKTWVTEELTYLESIASEPARDTLAVNYIEALEKLNTYQQQFNSFGTDKFLMYLPSSFTPDAGLSVAASQSTKQAQVARHTVKHRL
ncbi:hypothetical protein C8R48DRAFT_673269 [Suillus tomentosus]|nr:hypothetical protein C8R48DRAFT_673269 [Suillus tomentosus]